MKKSISFRQYQGTIAKMYTSINSKVFLQYLAIDESPFYLIFFSLLRYFIFNLYKVFSFGGVLVTSLKIHVYILK